MILDLTYLQCSIPWTTAATCWHQWNCRCPDIGIRSCRHVREVPLCADCWVLIWRPPTLLYGVRQLLTLYTSLIGDVIRSHDLNFHPYADDRQLYMDLIISDSGDTCVVVGRAEACLAEVRKWMWENMLKLNDDKTRALYSNIKAPRT